MAEPQEQPIHPLRIHSQPRFSAIGCDIKQDKFNTIARAVSGNMAKRIANALNRHIPDRRGQ